jgi:hypothetical protein
MKQLILLLTLTFASLASAQNVEIPDIWFKHHLLRSNTTTGIAWGSNNHPMVVDTNGDGEIQVSEAQNVYKLFLNNRSISNLTGIRSFSNLTYIWSAYNSITAADLSGLSNLSEIDFTNNYQMASINLQGVTALEEISIGHSIITDLDVSSCTNLRKLNCQLSNLTSLDVSMLPNLEILFLNDNNLTVVDVSMLPNLKTLALDSNQITSLDVSSNLSLNYLTCRDNQLTSLNLTGCDNLISMWCKGNQLTSVDLENKQSITSIICGNNLFTNLDFSDCTSLSFLNVSHTLISSLDLRYQPVRELNISACPYLTSLFIKNNSFDFGTESQYYFEDIYLTSVCVDVEEYREVRNLLNGIGLTDVNITSDCEVDDIADLKLFKASTVSMYPNPAEDSVTITDTFRLRHITLYDLEGRVIADREVNSNKFLLDIAHQPAGLYIAKITSETGTFYKKLIKK